MRDSAPEAFGLVLASTPEMDALTRGAAPGGVAIRLLHARSHEAATRGLPGQDYALVRHSTSSSALCFCVSDGVGSSYYGGFAAAYLAQRIVPWLAALDAGVAPTSELKKQLARCLDSWAYEAHAELPPVPSDVEGGALVREVLEGLRGEYGSETVFLAGRIDLRQDAAHAGSTPARVLLCWMGNVAARLYGEDQTRGDLVAGSDDANRWSTGRRVRGQVCASAHTLDGISRLIVHTDGADSVGDLIAASDDRSLSDRVRSLRETPASDDVTILDIAWELA